MDGIHGKRCMVMRLCLEAEPQRSILAPEARCKSLSSFSILLGACCLDG